MSTTDVKIQQLLGQAPGYWGERVLSQLGYATKISKVHGSQYDPLIASVVDFLSEKAKAEDAITKEAALKAEEMMAELSPAAKAYSMICVAHAHIDMNWMWGWHETVAVTLDTFRTVLNLMNEYSDFKFSQSQASIYKIVEEHAPEMLLEIKSRVKEGRWEVTASHWVEADKNMPNGESLARHLLYTKRYLTKLLEIQPESLNLDFEPDTFGHSLNVPEILASGGVRYYYHCRGYEGHQLYRWVAPSGREIVVYREPLWYNATIQPSMAFYVPEFCHQHGMDTMLKVYGVGDHGGGPTRRDLERIIEMNTWPVFPRIRFGTLAEFYKLVDKVAAQLPEVRGELNFVFSGCYTSQSRIKMANRVSEAVLYEAELLSAVAALSAGFSYPREALAKAWQNILFNQFHDILPGSGVIETREHALGLFQQTLAAANSARSLAMQSIASQIDTSQLIGEQRTKETVSEGAGVGFGTKDFLISQPERGRGKTRIFHIFNPSPFERHETAEVVVWDWQGELDGLVFRDDRGHAVDHQLLDYGFNTYWGHNYLRVLLWANVPPCGYRTYTMTEADYQLPTPLPRDPRVEKVDKFVLENDLVKVTFDAQNASIHSLIDKSSGQELIDKNRFAGVFRLIEEDAAKGMTAWVVGRYMNIYNLTENVKLRWVDYPSTNLRQAIAFEIPFRNSRLKATISLDDGSSSLRYLVECDWHEIGTKDKGIPQLGFYLPLGYACDSYKYDVPFGIIERDPLAMDVPANSWGLGLCKSSEKPSLMLVADSKYGFRGHDNALSLSLIRSSFDPDPYPELGVHTFKFAVCIVKGLSHRELINQGHLFNHPLSALSDTAHVGSLPTTGSFLTLEKGSVALSALKIPESAASKSVLIRGYETEGTDTEATLRFQWKVARAAYVDFNEKMLEVTSEIEVRENRVSFGIPAFSVASLYVEFE